MTVTPQTLQLVSLVAELVVSLVLLAGGFWVMVNSHDLGAQQAVSVLIGAVVAFWFQRRAGDQATTTVATLANGKLDSLQNAQAQTNAQLSKLTGAANVVAAQVTGNQGMLSDVDKP